MKKLLRFIDKWDFICCPLIGLALAWLLYAAMLFAFNVAYERAEEAHRQERIASEQDHERARIMATFGAPTNTETGMANALAHLSELFDGLPDSRFVDRQDFACAVRQARNVLARRVMRRLDPKVFDRAILPYEDNPFLEPVTPLPRPVEPAPVPSPAEPPRTGPVPA